MKKEEKRQYDKQYYKRNLEKIRDRAKRRYKVYSERIKENSRDYYKNNCEKKKEYSKQYYEDNRKKRLKQCRRWQKENPEKVREIVYEWRKNNPEKLKIIRKRSYEKNIDKNREYSREYSRENSIKIIEYNKQWRLDNLEKAKKQDNKRQNYKYKTDIRFKIRNRMANAMNFALKGNKNGGKWEDLVGYSVKDLINHLIKTMPKGYDWQDYLNGKLHIDHIIPIRAFGFNKSGDKEFKDCWSLYNLRLLPARENFIKNDEINPILLGLLMVGGE